MINTDCLDTETQNKLMALQTGFNTDTNRIKDQFKHLLISQISWDSDA